VLPWTREVFFRDVCAGLVSGFIFYLGLKSAFGGPLLIFACLLPLYLVGLAYGSRHAVRAAYASTFVSIVLLGPENCLPFVLFVLMPSCFFLRQLLQWRGNEHAPSWYPALRALAKLSVLTTIIFAGMGLIADANDQHFQTIIARSLPDDLNGMDPEAVLSLQHLLAEESFLIFALLGWMWVILLYGIAVLTNGFLNKHSLALRPSLALSPGGLPASLLVLLFICAVPALLSQGNTRFLGQMMALQMLLPYFLSGLALMHALSRARAIPRRRLWISSFYIALIFTGWPAVIVVGAGLYVQLAEILDRPKKIG